jgi:hypothetical protein
MTANLPDGTQLPPVWAPQVAADYTEAAAEILGALGRDKQIDGIGLGAGHLGLEGSRYHEEEEHRWRLLLTWHLAGPAGSSMLCWRLKFRGTDAQFASRSAFI